MGYKKDLKSELEKKKKENELKSAVLSQTHRTKASLASNCDRRKKS